MKTTTNYALKKPEARDLANIQDFNENADIIDRELSKRITKSDIKVTSVNKKTGNVSLKKSDVGLDTVNNWEVSTTVNNNSTTTYVTASAVKQAYDKAVEVINSSTDGKRKLATAITGKGVSTSASDTFSKMAENINKIATLTIDGQNVQTDLVLKSLGGDKYLRLTAIPYYFDEGCAVVYNNEVHIIGSYNSSGNRDHYKWNGSSWTKVSTLPYGFYKGCVVVYNDEIHIIGGYASTTSGLFTDKHYKWNGKTWTSVSTLPYKFIGGSAVVYNNEIHIFGSGYSNYAPGNTSKLYGTNHYKWNGSEWTSVSTLPLVFHNGTVVIYRDQIHMLGGNNDGISDRHYKWDGSKWILVSTLKSSGYKSSGVVYNDQIHMPGSHTKTDYYVWNGTEWIKKTNVPVASGELNTVVYNNQIILLYASVSYVICHNSCIII